MKNMNFPKVTIIIPVYNVDQYLEQCLDSVINQTLQEIQIICVNDCSNDRSLEILELYRHMDRRIEIIDNAENQGLSSVRNQGIEAARGQYIYFLDSDDMIVLNAMEELYNCAEEGKLDVVIFEASVVFETEDLKSEFAGYTEEFKHDYNGVHTGSEIYCKLIQNWDWLSSVCRQFWSRTYIEKNQLKFYEGILHEDELFTFLAILGTERLMCLRKKYFIRRMRASSIMTSAFSKKNVLGYFITYCEMITSWEKKHCNEEENYWISTHIFRIYKRIVELYYLIAGEIEIVDLVTASHCDHRIIKQFHLFQKHVDPVGVQLVSLKQQLPFIKKSENLVIYGAGAIGRWVLEVLDRNELGIHAFVVTEKGSNPNFIMGHRVIEIQNLIDEREEVLVLVAVASKHQASVRERLLQLNFKNVIFL